MGEERTLCDRPLVFEVLHGRRQADGMAPPHAEERLLGRTLQIPRLASVEAAHTFNPTLTYGASNGADGVQERR